LYFLILSNQNPSLFHDDVLRGQGFGGLKIRQDPKPLAT